MVTRIHFWQCSFLQMVFYKDATMNISINVSKTAANLDMSVKRQVDIDMCYLETIECYIQAEKTYCRI